MFLRITAVKTETFLTSLRYSLQVLIEEMGYKPVQYVPDSCHRLLIDGEDATAELFLHVGEEVVV